MNLPVDDTAIRTGKGRISNPAVPADCLATMAPENEKGLGVCSTEPTKTHTTDPAAIVSEGATDSKRFMTLAAQAAIAGHTLRRVPSGFVLSRWTYSKHAADLDTIEVLLRRMGAAI